MCIRDRSTASAAAPSVRWNGSEQDIAGIAGRSASAFLSFANQRQQAREPYQNHACKRAFGSSGCETSRTAFEAETGGDDCTLSFMCPRGASSEGGSCLNNLSSTDWSLEYVRGMCRQQHHATKTRDGGNDTYNQRPSRHPKKTTEPANFHLVVERRVFLFLTYLILLPIVRCSRH